MLRYQPRLDALDDVQTPTTVFVSNDVDSAVSTINAEMVEQGWSRAFLRSPYKAAPQRLKAGSFIQQPETSHIRSTVESLHVQLNNSPWPVGDKLILRERLDLSFCLEPSHTMEHPEIRFFIEGGEILGRTPQDCSSNQLCQRGFEYLEERIDNASPPVNQAKIVAQEFDDYHWCADFVLTTRGEWYCVELNFGGVRWDGDQERWRNMCGYGDKVAHSPEVIHGYVIDKLFPSP